MARSPVDLASALLAAAELAPQHSRARMLLLDAYRGSRLAGRGRWSGKRIGATVRQAAALLERTDANAACHAALSKLLESV